MRDLASFADGLPFSPPSSRALSMVKAGIEHTYKRSSTRSEEAVENRGEPKQPEILPPNPIEQAFGEYKYLNALHPHLYSPMLERSPDLA